MRDVATILFAFSILACIGNEIVRAKYGHVSDRHFYMLCLIITLSLIGMTIATVLLLIVVLRNAG